MRAKTDRNMRTVVHARFIAQWAPLNWVGIPRGESGGQLPRSNLYDLMRGVRRS